MILASAQLCGSSAHAISPRAEGVFRQLAEAERFYYEQTLKSGLTGPEILRWAKMRYTHPTDRAYLDLEAPKFVRVSAPVKMRAVELSPDGYKYTLMNGRVLDVREDGAGKTSVNGKLWPAGPLAARIQFLRRMIDLRVAAARWSFVPRAHAQGDAFELGLMLAALITITWTSHRWLTHLEKQRSDPFLEEQTRICRAVATGHRDENFEARTREFLAEMHHKNIVDAEGKVSRAVCAAAGSDCEKLKSYLKCAHEILARGPTPGEPPAGVPGAAPSPAAR